MPGSVDAPEVARTRDIEPLDTGRAGRAPRIVLLGPPGAGKGTQAVRLAARFGVPHVATGEILRDNARRGTPLGQMAKRYMDAGELVPDDVVTGIVSERLAAPDCRHGFVLDGYPRSVAQARALSGRLDELGMPLEAVVSLDVEQEELLQRLAARARADDGERTIRSRLRVFAASSGPLLDYYRRGGLLTRVHGVGDPDELAELLVDLTG